MSKVFLQRMTNDISFDDLPVNWNSFDLAAFSKTKRLWDYQQTALENAVKVLWKYYQDFADYSPHEDATINLARKQRFFEWYRDNGLEEDLTLRLNGNRDLDRLLGEYYIVNEGALTYDQFINRACFWMATGSGKTLVIVKLIQLLWELSQRREIPAHDILILTHRDDLIEQLKAHVAEFNAARSDLFIQLRELREYATAKRENPSLFKDREITVFYYRSDNLSDEQKEKIIDYRNYDDAGKWYVLLDEAHKGDKEDSKRQHIYSILSRNGFLFNFSATFTDPRDLVTTAANFNLSEFIRGGYGKHIAILLQETRAFKSERDDYNSEEKQKIVLKSLMMLAYARKFADVIRAIQPAAYHKPLLLTLVNSVNTQDADLKLFFRELEKIGKGKISQAVWKAAKQELWEELKARPEFLFEDGSRVEVDETVFDALSEHDILKFVFNANRKSDIEVRMRPSNKQELALALKGSGRAFALIKIGDISGWLKEELAGYEIDERFEDESYFERLNTDDSDINILMGSRSFYEGWDSNRPNVINFINIGTGVDAKKFILQSVGRGVRIEPIKNQRKRLQSLHNANAVDPNLYDQIKHKADPPESLFIFGTNRYALNIVLNHLNETSGAEKETVLDFFEVNEEAQRHQLLIPVYKDAAQPLYEQRDPAKFEIAVSELGLLKDYVDYIEDDRVLLAIHETEPMKIGFLRNSLQDDAKYYKPNGRRVGNVNLLFGNALKHFSLVPREFERLKVLEDEIRHFTRITVTLRDISRLEGAANIVKTYRNPSIVEKELKERFERGQMTLDELMTETKQSARMTNEVRLTIEGKGLVFKNIANHYYIPVVLADESERVEYIKHIIQTPSEVKFINDLEAYAQRDENRFKQFDWWLFSKLDESLDDVYIPYYNPDINSFRRFKPDFIFWFQKGDKYFVVFIDPKGTKHTDYQHKVDWYKRIFEDQGMARILSYDHIKTKVLAFLYTEDASQLSEGYKKYWFDNLDIVLAQLE